MKHGLRAVLGKDLLHWWSVGLGLGLLPKAPGTWGSLLAIPLGYLGKYFPLWELGVAWIILFFISVWGAERLALVLGEEDPSAIVSDEIMALWAVYLCTGFTLTSVVLGFALFRLFDITKPWPIAYAESLSSPGWAIMCDDLLAAGYALLVLLAILRVF